MPRPLALSSLPLFPLGTVLLPGGTLALRVFEVRYLDMVRKCQQADAPFGVVALRSGDEVRRPGMPQEQFHDVGTLAVIEQLDAPQSGLMHLQCRGTDRFRIQSRRQLPHGLWVADVELCEPDQPVAVPPDLQGIATALAQVITQLRQRDPEFVQAPPTPDQLADCGWVANRWCELLPVPPEIKQQLMALDNPLLRLELVGDVLDRTGIAP